MQCQPIFFVGTNFPGSADPELDRQWQEFRNNYQINRFGNDGYFVRAIRHGHGHGLFARPMSTPGVDAVSNCVLPFLSALPACASFNRMWLMYNMGTKTRFIAVSSAVIFLTTFILVHIFGLFGAVIVGSLLALTEHEEFSVDLQHILI